MPTFADGYSSSSPIGKSPIVGVFTALEHTIPALIGARLPLLASVAVGRFGFNDTVDVEAATAVRVSSGQIAAYGFDFDAAFTAAGPSDMANSPPCVMEDGQTTEFLPSEISKSYHCHLMACFGSNING